MIKDQTIAVIIAIVGGAIFGPMLANWIKSRLKKRK